MLDMARNHRDDLNQRVFILGIFIVIFFLVLWIRLWSLQVVHGMFYKERSKANYVQNFRLKSPRGSIYDRNGILLAENVPSFNLMINREEAGEKLNTMVNRLVEQLDLDETMVLKNKNRWKWVSRFKSVLLASNLTFAQVNYAEARKYLFPGISIRVTYHRNYPQESSACHAIGYVGEVSEKEIRAQKYEPGDIIGKTGVEHSFNNELQGLDGWEKVEVDALGKVKRVLYHQDPVPGVDIYLTLDIQLQKHIEEIFKGYVGSVLVMEAKTGELLAMVNNPSYNLNNFADGMTPKQWSRLYSNHDKPLINRAISGRYSPASVFKIVTMIAAMEEKMVDLSTSIECKGWIRLNKSLKHCWNLGGHGFLKIQDALAYSCNIFFYNLGAMLGIDNIARWARLFGLGSSTGIELPNEYPGLVPDKTWKRNTFPNDKTWWPGETLQVAIGQGSLIVTPIQVLAMIGIIANNGIHVKPKILKKIVDPQTRVIHEIEPTYFEPVPLHAKTFETIKAAMKKAVQEGTAKGCQPEWLHVMGKTGTVQIASRKLLKQFGNKINKEFLDHAWLATCGGLDPDNPELVVVVFIEHGGKKGAQAKLDITRDIYSWYFPAQLDSGNGTNLATSGSWNWRSDVSD